MAGWDSVPSWTPFEDINGGQQFSKQFNAQALNALAGNIAYLYEHMGESEWLGEYVDGLNYQKGAIVSYEGNIYLCIKDLDDQQDPTNTEYWKMLNKLPNLISKTITENGTYKASEEVDDDSIIGTWYLNKVLTSETMGNASIANTLNYNGNFQAFKSGTDGLYTYDQFDYMNNNSDVDRLFYHQWNDWVDILAYQNGEWTSEEYRTIVIDKEPSSSSQIEPMLNWLKVNATKIIVDGYSEVIVNVEASDSPLPIEVSTEAEMTALLTSGEVGGVYKYTGTTGTYENGALYVLEVDI